MDVSSTTSTTSSSSASSSTSQIFDNYEAFLQLLLTQLENQDPLDPVDTTEFTNQLVQYASVEQQMEMNSNLDTLISATSANSNVAALDYLGLTVEATGSQAYFDGSSSAAWTYTLDSEASSVTLTISDGDGNIVQQVSGDTASGEHDFTWDGTTADGGTAAAGTYTLTVTATDSSGASVETSTATVGTVTGVDTSSGSIVLYIGDLAVSASDVTKASRSS